ncbi:MULTISPECIES: nucleotide exchange factor GrpE [Aeromonas]|jgi:molecular chaperone GrpE|uniref:Protein GrpE n=2 Tax=Aeromonas TaxID=642 RepID=A0A5F0KCU2_9GAMM|nr:MULTISPECIES: nucleotide exchange factor GrpE [Aeromonas]MBP0603829.1 nucleotide exchange factor GrpE [Aeromonas sanarellii]MEB6608035.1 nucleotide exchange factor GrpE [Aeromonas sanarellii]QXC30161.1 nucleotide exchange factor GrpE [Aeromonas sp. FDAARGOS 1409]TFF78122.1 nucleotide exchange factor GrpE [Aeromonas taiwanensis]TFF78606.1 nucleotide exchange factor GrpE [Aeromonas taiwanensis]
MSHEEQKVEAMEQLEAQPVEPTDVDSEVTAEQARIAELEAQLEAAQQASLEERERAIRAVAEMENLRRRAAQDVEKAHKFALEKFAAELLPVLDNLERAIELADKENDTLKPMIEGVELTLKSMQSGVAKFGLVALDPTNQPFDPNAHQAMSMVPSADVAPNTVIAVMQKGYELNGRVIRPAMVMVSKSAD